MDTHTAADPDAGPERADRPRSVDLALAAILVRCGLALAAAFALFGAKAELRRSAATLHPEWSAATLADRVDSELRSNLVVSVVYIGLVLLVAKYIRDGRSWARWVYAFLAFLVAGDLFRVTGVFSGDNVLFRLLSGLTGLASIVAVVLLFLPSSAGYFRRPGVSSASLGALFGGRAAMAATRHAPDGTADRAPGSGVEPVSLSKAGKPAVAATASSAQRSAPRAKSRKQAPQ
jgi:hypothetical protein